MGAAAGAGGCGAGGDPRRRGTSPEGRDPRRGCEAIPDCRAKPPGQRCPLGPRDAPAPHLCVQLVAGALGVPALGGDRGRRGAPGAVQGTHPRAGNQCKWCGCGRGWPRAPLHRWLLRSSLARSQLQPVPSPERISPPWLQRAPGSSFAPQARCVLSGCSGEEGLTPEPGASHQGAAAFAPSAAPELSPAPATPRQPTFKEGWGRFRQNLAGDGRDCKVTVARGGGDMCLYHTSFCGPQLRVLQG